MSVEEKTPVQVLQEFCQKEGKTPKYVLVQAEGQDHLPTFFYDLTVGDVTISGIQGLSKKKAKHAAAEAMLEKLEVVTPSTEEGTTISKIKAAKLPQKNAVGELQQLCTQKEWPAPKYTVTSVEGPSHAPVFTMECAIETLHAAVSGTGKCKKEAKQLVAAQMLQSLAGSPHIQQLTVRAEEAALVHNLQKNGTHSSCDEEERNSEEGEKRKEEEEGNSEEGEERKEEEEGNSEEGEEKKEEERVTRR